jgi:hypothetical protein
MMLRLPYLAASTARVKKSSDSLRFSANSSPASGRVLWILLGAIVLAGGIAVIIWFFHPTPVPEANRRRTAAPAADVPPTSNPATAAPGQPPARSHTGTNNAPHSDQLSPAALNKAATLARQNVSSLAKTDLSHGPLTAAQADAWNQNFQQLAKQGMPAIPAIREFLEKNQDIVFDADADRQATGYSSFRLALIDMLQKIGGPEAQAASLDVLQRTADPVEIATLSRNLERAAPGKYAEAISNAAREALGIASSPGWDGRDVALLFEVLKRFAGAAAVPDLQKSSGTWFDYAPIVLADLPNGAGVPALVEWIKNPNAPLFAGNDVYLRMLAQASTQYPDAMEALLEQARANRIPSSAWDGIAAAMAGSRLELALSFFNPASPGAPRREIRTYHISAGNQTFLDVAPPADRTPKQLADRARAIDQLSATTENPFGQQALQKAKQSLSGGTR